MRLQPIENLSKTYSGDPHLGQTKLNGLLLLTIHGVLILLGLIPKQNLGFFDAFPYQKAGERRAF